MNVLLYTTKRCHLCDQAKQALKTLGIGYEERDATDDPERFLRTPVIEAGGVVLAEGEITVAALRRALRSIY